MRNITLLLIFLGLLLSVQSYAQIPTVLKESDFSTKTGVIKDSRDGKYYHYKKYGDKDWFMQNLNWNDNGNVGWAGPEDLDGSKYGRFYKTGNVSTVCPTGWKSATNVEWKDLTNNTAIEYKLTKADVGDANKLDAPGTYDQRNFMVYMRGGGMANKGGLWIAKDAGSENAEVCAKTQFNYLPSGFFNGTGYQSGVGIGVRAYVIGSGNDRYRNYEGGGDAPSGTGNSRNTLKHETKSGSYGNVRCVRPAQGMRDQIILAEEIEAKTLADGEFYLPAKATSGLAMTYISSNPKVATVDADGKVTIKAVGETTITMSQAGDVEFNPAPEAQSRVLAVHAKKFFVTLPVVKGALLSPSITNNVVVGDAPFEFSVTRISGYEGEPVVALSPGGTLTAVSQARDVYKYQISDMTANLTVTIADFTEVVVVGQPRFATISDIQAGAEGWEAKVTTALDNLIAQTPKLDAIFITGDITDGGTQSQFTEVKALVASKVPADIAVYYAMGNDDWKASATLSGEYFTKTMEQDLNQLIVVRGYPFITISAETKDLASSYLEPTQDFLNEKLTYASTKYPGKPIFVIQQVPNTGTVYGAAEWGSSNITTILEKYPQVVSISGNSHYFLANELSIYQNKFTAINTGSIAYGRMEKGFDDGLTPPGSETMSEGCIFTVDASNAVEVKRLDFLNNTEIKQAWKIEAPHDGTAFAYKGRTGGAAPYFESGSAIVIKNLTDITFTAEAPAAKDDDDVTQYLIEILDVDQKPIMKPIFKFTSDYYLASSGTVAATISKDITRLVEGTDYYVRVTATDAWGKKSTPLLSDKITTKTKDITNPTVFDIITERVIADQESRFSTTSLETSVNNALTVYSDVSPIGSFTDLNYAGTSAVVWSSAVGPSMHLNRLRDMAMAYVRPDSKYYNDDELYNKIVNAAEYWYSKNPTSSNWWHGTVGNPQKMGVFLLEMRKGEKKLPVTTENKIIHRMEFGVGRQAEDTVNEGANRSDIAIHYLYRACLTGSDALMSRALKNGYEPIKLASGSEGIRVDGAYMLHSAQLQLTSYGQELMNTSVSFGTYTAGTEYSMPEDKLEILSNFARNSYFKAFRGQYIYHNSTGRSVSRAGNLKRSGSARFAEALILMDPNHKDEYEIILKRLYDEEPASYGMKPLNKTFFVGDYVIHERPEFGFAVRTVSARTVRSEWGNGEALQTYFMSDGSTSFMQKGDEYHNIPVGWNWTRLPGTTAPQYPFENVPQWVNNYKGGTTRFVGGASDGIYSVNTYHWIDTFKDDTSSPKSPHPINTEGHKSWFFFDNEVVCLGAGITSSNVYPLNTTVEQNLLKSDVIVSSDGAEKTIAQSFRGESSYADNLKWVMHNGAGYFFPQGGKVHTENVTTTRPWSQINNSQSKNPVSTDVFSLWFDHGLNPTDVSYAYIVVPNKNTAAEMNSYDASNIEILLNTVAIQAVKDKKANMLQIIFSEAGVFEHEGMTIESDRGAAIILKNLGSPEVTMHIADPGQNQKAITVLSLIPSVSSLKKETVCDFSGTGKYAGESKEFKINAQSVDAPRDADFIYSSVILEDTYVSALAKTTKYGTSDLIETKLDVNAGYNRQAFTKFSLNDLDKFTDTENYEVKVSVEFFVMSANTGINSTNWVLRPTTDITWVETAMTWNNKPAVENEIISRQKSFGPKAGTGTGNGTGNEPFHEENRVIFDITEYALSEYAKDNKIISLNINNDVAGTTVNSMFATREHAEAKVHPVIVVKLYKKDPVVKQEQTITFPAIADITLGTGTVTAVATASSGLKVTYVSSNPAVATIDENGVITTLAVGTTTITASQAGNAQFLPAIDVAVDVVVKAAPIVLQEQTITFPAIADVTLGTGTVTAVATASSGLKVTYTSSNTAVATIDADGVITTLAVGTTTITASQAGNAVYLPATDVSVTVTVKSTPVTLKDQTITFPAIADVTLGTGTVTAGATASSGLKVTYTSSNLAVATIDENGVITTLAVGTTTITASQAGNAEYKAAVDVTADLTVKSTPVVLKDQTITFPAIADITLGTGTVTAGATTNSGLKVTYVSSNTAVATIDADGVITTLAVGTTTITASQAGNAEYKPATNVAVTVTVKAAPIVLKDQTITFPTIADITLGTGNVTAGATADSGLKVTYVSSNTSVATIDADGVITAKAVGTTTITASQAGNAEYKPATNVAVTVTVKAAPIVQKDQTITFPAIGDITLGTGTVTAKATADSDLKVTYVSSNTSVATIDADGVITAKAVGTTTITASQAGNAEYKAAADVTVDVKVVSTPVVLKEQTITFPAIADITLGTGTVTAGATTNSGLKVTYVSSNTSVATIDADGVITAKAVGTTTITASQAGNAEYKPATNVAVTVTVKAAPIVQKDQTITFPAIGDITLGTGTVTAKATASSGLKVTYVSSNTSVATIDADGVITAKAVGTTTITASQAGNAEYKPATNVAVTVTVKAAPIVQKDQTITFPAIGDITLGTGTVTAKATADSGLKVAYTSSNPAVATIDANGVITVLTAGTTTIIASQAGNAEYKPATDVTRVVIVKEATLPGKMVLTINGEEWDGVSQYTIPCSSDASQLYLAINESSGAKIKVGDKEVTSHIFGLSNAPIQTFELSVIPQSGATTNHTLVVNKGVQFEDITVTKWGNTFIVNKDPKTNGGLTISGYKWFENGVEVSTKQYYEATKGGTAAEYLVELTTPNGVVRTCPTMITPRIVLLNIYPNPVKVGEPIYIDASQMSEEFFVDAKAYLYSLAGYTVMEKAVREKVSTVETPMTPGTYVLKVVSKTYSKEFKVIIK